MVDNLRTQVLKWFVETGYMDGYGMGYWNGTTESVEVESESDAIALQNNWLEQGKLIRTHWGELRPNSGYGIFRIRSSWVDIQNPLTDHIKAQAAEIERLRGELAKAGRDLNMARYGQPDFAWSIHKQAMADIEAKLVMAVEALEKLSTPHSFSGVAILGRRLSESLMGREIRARMEYARATLAELKGTKP